MEVEVEPGSDLAWESAELELDASKFVCVKNDVFPKNSLCYFRFWLALVHRTHKLNVELNEGD